MQPWAELETWGVLLDFGAKDGVSTLALFLNMMAAVCFSWLCFCSGVHLALESDVVLLWWKKKKSPKDPLAGIVTLSRLRFPAAPALIQDCNKGKFFCFVFEKSSSTVTIVSKRITYYRVAAPLRPVCPPGHSSATFSHQRTHFLPLRFP